MRKKSNSKSKKIRERIHKTEGEGDTSGSLQDRISLQVRSAQETTMIESLAKDLNIVPRLADLPKLSMEWYVSDDQGVAEDLRRQILILEIMRVLSREQTELNDHTALEMYLNVLVIMLPELKPKLRKILMNYNYVIDEISWGEKKESIDLEGVDLIDEIEGDPDPYWIIVCLGVYFALMGKQLNSANYNAWMKGRVRAFAQSCGVKDYDDILSYLVPNSRNSEIIYLTTSSKYEVRREIFLFIKAIANDKGVYTAISKAALVVLAGTELGNFNLTNKYIVVENPILLCWSELAKYTPHLIAAIDKYQALGEDAPYCKLLYPSSELQEFNRNSIKVFATIAREIAILEGVESFKNYEGTTTNPTLNRIVDKALWLVKAFGGANTKVTQEVRENLFADVESNRDIINDLSFGAHIERKVENDSSESESDDENIAS